MGAWVGAATTAYQAISGANQRTRDANTQARAQMKQMDGYTPTAPKQEPKPVGQQPTLGQAIGGTSPAMTPAQTPFQQAATQTQSVGAPAAGSAPQPSGTAQDAAKADAQPAGKTTTQRVADAVTLGATVGEAIRGQQQQTAAANEAFRARMQTTPRFVPSAVNQYQRMYGGGGYAGRY